jgi:hypothetical protein
VRDLKIVEVICDTTLGREQQWSESDIRSYFETLLTTVIVEETLLPLEATLRSSSDEKLIDVMISRRVASGNSASPSRQLAKAQLIAESAEVADQRATWDAETKNLHNALASIASLQASAGACETTPGLIARA